MCFKDFQLDFPDPTLAHTYSYCQLPSCLACPPSVAKLSNVLIKPSPHSLAGFHEPVGHLEISQELYLPLLEYLIFLLQIPVLLFHKQDV